MGREVLFMQFGLIKIMFSKVKIILGISLLTNAIFIDGCFFARIWVVVFFENQKAGLFYSLTGQNHTFLERDRKLSVLVLEFKLNSA